MRHYQKKDLFIGIFNHKFDKDNNNFLDGEELGEIFDFLDVNKDGELSQDEFKVLNYDNILIHCDKDGNGTISKKEFISCMLINQTDDEEAIEYLFNMLDIDNNKELTHDELKILNINEEEFKALDKNNDKTITLDEFRYLYSILRRKKRTQKADLSFSFLWN